MRCVVYFFTPSEVPSCVTPFILPVVIFGYTKTGLIYALVCSYFVCVSVSVCAVEMRWCVERRRLLSATARPHERKLGESRLGRFSSEQTPHRPCLTRARHAPFKCLTPSLTSFFLCLSYRSKGFSIGIAWRTSSSSSGTTALFPLSFVSSFLPLCPFCRKYGLAVFILAAVPAGLSTHLATLRSTASRRRFLGTPHSPTGEYRYPSAYRRQPSWQERPPSIQHSLRHPCQGGGKTLRGSWQGRRQEIS